MFIAYIWRAQCLPPKIGVNMILYLIELRIEAVVASVESYMIDVL